MRTIAALALLTLAACDAGVEPAAGDETTAASPIPTEPAATADASPEPAAPTVELPGEYRVAGVDGMGIDEPYAITAAITESRIDVDADCLKFAWDHTAHGDAIATTRLATAGCERGLTAVEEAVVAAFDAATSVARTPANGIELSGGGHTVTLFSQ